MPKGASDELVTIERLQRALLTAATLVEIYGEPCVPIFERIERELLAMERQRSAVDRARLLVKRISDRQLPALTP